MTQPKLIPRQFSLREIFVLVTLVAIWCAVGRWNVGPWLAFSAFGIGPVIFFLGQRWQMTWLEFTGVMLTLCSPCLITFLFELAQATFGF